MVTLKARDIVTIGLLAATMETAKLALASIANIELVSLLLVIFTLIYKKKSFYIIAVFVLLEGLFFGFGIWWVSYLYVWGILAGLALCFQKNTNIIFWAFLLGLYGLLFGALCAIPYFITGGIHGGLAYWIAGIPFDIVHCAGNFILTLVLFKPLYRLFKKISVQDLQHRS